MAFLSRLSAAIRTLRFGERAFTPTADDLRARTPLSDITPASFSTAYQSAELGNMSDLGDLIDMMLATDPVVRGVRAQLTAGVKAQKLEILPANDSPKAIDIAEEFKRRMTAADSSYSAFVEKRQECRYRGGGLIEPVWKFEGGSWRWTDFVLVPQQRIRFDQTTGEMCFAWRSWDFAGQPVSTFEPGTFVAVTPDSHVLDFSKRGLDRAVLWQWFQRMNAKGWWAIAIERFGMPFPVVTAQEQDKAAAKKAITDAGAAGGLVLSPGSTYDLKERGGNATNVSPHGAFIERGDAEIAINYLGATQTVNIAKDQGSKASAGTHLDIREDRLRDECEGVANDLRAFGTAWAIRDYGPEAAGLAPIPTYVFEEPVDIAQEIENMKAGEELGLDLTVGEAYKRVRWPIPDGVREFAEVTLREYRRQRGQADPQSASVTAFPGARR